MKNLDSDTVTVVDVGSAEECYSKTRDFFGVEGEFRVTWGGVDILEVEVEHLENQLLEVELEVVGGKGGFGSLLRIAAAQKKHFNNFDSCRDSNGRRLRDIKNDIRLVEFLKRKKMQEKELSLEIADIDRSNLEKKDNYSNKAQAQVDEEYSRKIDEMRWRLGKAVQSGYLNKRKAKIEVEEEGEGEEQEDEIDEVTKKMKHDHKTNKELGNGYNKNATEINAVQATENGLEISSNDEPPKEPNQILEINNLSNGINKQNTIEASIGPQKHDILLVYEPIDLQTIESIDQISSIDDNRIKHELKRLGIKAGGTNSERIKRLWDIKLNPSNLLNNKFITKK